jgi:hypothetical protein
VVKPTTSLTNVAPAQADISIKPRLKLDKTNNQTLATSILDIFGGGKREKLFDTSNLKKTSLKKTQENYGKRTSCPDFYLFVPVFNQIKQLIDTRNSSIEPFRRGNVINIGDVFIWDGITCFVAEEIRMEHDAQGKPNPRLRIVFDNCTHTDMLKQSFSQGMYHSNRTRRISEKIDYLLNKMNNVVVKYYWPQFYSKASIFFLARLGLNHRYNDVA